MAGFQTYNGNGRLIFSFRIYQRGGAALAEGGRIIGEIEVRGGLLTFAVTYPIRINSPSMQRTAIRSSGRSAPGTKRLSKQMLLPISRQVATDTSLLNHVALAVCR